MISYLILLYLINVSILHKVSCGFFEIYRLPKNIKPLRYILTVEPNLTRFEDDYIQIYNLGYSGSVVIDLKILETTASITLNKGSSLEIDESSIGISDIYGKELELIKTIYNSTKSQYTILTKEELIVDNIYTLRINRFTNTLNRGNTGFFVAYYQLGENWNEVGILAATHFQQNYAKDAFPCFDEPAFKARFLVNVIRKADFYSLSNTELESTERLENGRIKDRFKETPIISTYTLAFAVSQYDYISSGRIRIFGAPSLIEASTTATFELDLCEKTLQALERFTGIPYVIGKMDIFTVPARFFQYKGMENWGLTMYQGVYPLLKDYTATNIQEFVQLIVHEFAHQWFGNLVTPEWWDYLWLSESFAAYLEYYIGNKVAPSLSFNDQFQVDVLHNAFRQEEYPFGEGELNFPLDVVNFPPFHIMYSKGSSIIRIMVHFLTPEVFRRGLKIYLSKNKVKSTLPSHLYEALQEAVDFYGTGHLLNYMTVGEIMKTWDSAQRFPIITVQRDYRSGRLHINQTSALNNTGKWIVPINFAFSSSRDTAFRITQADFWLTKKRDTINRNFPTHGWLLVNKQQTGYYRVNYDVENWRRILHSIRYDKQSIHVYNRAQLIEDAFYFARNKVIPWITPLKLSEFLRIERDYTELATFINSFASYVLSQNSQKNRNASESEVFQDHPLMKVINPADTEVDLQKMYLRNVLGRAVTYLGTSARPGVDTHLDQLGRYKLRMLYQNYFENELGDGDNFNDFFLM